MNPARNVPDAPRIRFSSTPDVSRYPRRPLGGGSVIARRLAQIAAHVAAIGDDVLDATCSPYRTG